MDIYPVPGSNADRVLTHIQSNPGISNNKIIDDLKMNPSVVRGIMRTLVQKGLVRDAPTAQQHRYTARVPVL